MRTPELCDDGNVRDGVPSERVSDLLALRCDQYWDLNRRNHVLLWAESNEGDFCMFSLSIHHGSTYRTLSSEEVRTIEVVPANTSRQGKEIVVLR